MYKNIICFCLAMFFSFRAYGATLWEGKWEMGRYFNDIGGFLEIKNCQNNVCDFEVRTINGAHTCGIDGKLKINGNSAQHREKSVFADQYGEEYAVVDFKLNQEKNIIEIKGNGVAHSNFCGMQGVFEGEYENEANPLRFETGFDCWAENLNETEKTICAHKNLAQADKEMSEKYNDIMTKEWKIKRDSCQTNVDCLWNFYVTFIKQGYEERSGKALNLYEYLGNLEEDGLYYPTEFVLLDDYFRQHMEKVDYEEWKWAFSKISIGHNQCQNCFYHEYGVAGLFTIVESAFYISKDEIWIAFLHIDSENNKNEYIVVYAPKGKTIGDIPPAYEKWLQRLKSFYPNGIKLKYFK